MANELSADQPELPRRGVSPPSPGSLVMPGQEMEVEVMSPPRIVWYWVLKQNIDRLTDAITDERADRRLEYLFGFVGLSFGTVRDAWLAVENVVNEKPFSVLDFAFFSLFVVSVVFVGYFWKLAEKKESKSNEILSDIFEKEYAAHVTRTVSEPGGGTTGGPTGTVRKGESVGG